MRFFLILTLLFSQVIPTTAIYADTPETATDTASAAETASENEEPSPPHGIDVSGMGWFTNRELRRTLQLLLPSGDTGNPIKRNHIEDASYLLQAETTNRGYLNPTLHFTLHGAEGSSWVGIWKENDFTPDLPPQGSDFQQMEIRIDPGVLYFFDHLEIHGVEKYIDTEPRLFFHTTGFLFNTEANRYYSPSRKAGGIRSILTKFQQEGYLDARLTDEDEIIDNHTGAVSLKLNFQAGSRYWIRKVETHILLPNGEIQSKEEEYTETIYSTFWLQDYLQNLRRPWFSRGYPDVEVRVVSESREITEQGVLVDLVLEVNPGSLIKTGSIHFEGVGHTRKTFLRELVDLQEGENFDILEAENARQRLARLGIFDVVEIHYNERQDNRQDITYRAIERPNYEVSLLAGYGSYESIRGGVGIVHRNIWGLAHQSDLKAIQSMKSTRAEYLYTIPEFWPNSGNLFGKLHYLDRDEITFERHEIGGAVGTDYYWQALGIQSSLQYSYETVKSNHNRFLEAPGVTSAQVGSLQLTLSRNNLDNILYPTKGYKAFVSYEFANRALAGTVDFQRLESGFSYHTPVAGGLLFHSSLKHGMAWSAASTKSNLPVNRRFFPGGENSIRGYLEGQASPRGANGGEIGAEVYVLLNLELEQPIMPDLSIVVFSDTLGASADYTNYPADYWLTSVGVGLRYRTIIGPIRLEYGHNLNPRPNDPSGALHFSIGFPF